MPNSTPNVYGCCLAACSLTKSESSRERHSIAATGQFRCDESSSGSADRRECEPAGRPAAKPHREDRRPALGAGISRRPPTAARPERGSHRSAIDQLFEATLALLFRLLFVLYAESRDLLPTGNARYYTISLRRNPGRDPRRWQGRLLRRARPALYDRLCQLFETVHQGDPGRNVPAYGGRLFQAAAPANGEPSAASVPFDRMAQFLREHKVADRRLALAIDALSRDGSKRTGTRAFIDYASLDVRRLGSTYERLLNCTLRRPKRRGPTAGRPPPHVGKETLQRPGVPGERKRQAKSIRLVLHAGRDRPIPCRKHSRSGPRREAGRVASRFPHGGRDRGRGAKTSPAHRPGEVRNGAGRPSPICRVADGDAAR